MFAFDENGGFLDDVSPYHLDDFFHGFHGASRADDVVDDSHFSAFDVRNVAAVDDELKVFG